MFKVCTFASAFAHKAGRGIFEEEIFEKTYIRKESSTRSKQRFFIPYYIYIFEYVPSAWVTISFLTVIFPFRRPFGRGSGETKRRRMT